MSEPKRCMQAVLAGFGGQGILFAGKIIANAGLLEDREAFLASQLRARDARRHRQLQRVHLRRPYRKPACAQPRRAGGHEPAVARQVRA